MKNFYYFIFFISIISCKEKNHNQSHGHHSNEHMNKSSFEELVDRFENKNRDTWQKPEKIIQLFSDIKDKIIMDIGAGTGYFSFRLAEKGAIVIAADVDKRFQQYIENKKKETNTPNIETRLTQYDDPLLKNEEVHLVIIVNTYHHISDRKPYFKKVWNGIKPSGYLMVVDFKKMDSPHGPPKHLRISASQVSNELKEAEIRKCLGGP